MIRLYGDVTAIEIDISETLSKYNLEPADVSNICYVAKKDLMQADDSSGIFKVLDVEQPYQEQAIDFDTSNQMIKIRFDKPDYEKLNPGDYFHKIAFKFANYGNTWIEENIYLSEAEMIDEKLTIVQDLIRE